MCCVCVGPVLCLLNVLPAQFAVWGLRQVLLLLFYFCFFALLPAQCAVCVSPVLCLLNVLPAQFAVQGYNKSSYYYFILLFFCTTASAVCCVYKSYVVFALLPAQCAVCVSLVLCLYYCQHSVLCV